MDQIQKIPFVGVEHGPNLSHLFEKKVFTDGENTLPYRIYVPKDLSPEKRYPLVLFFHGAGERGNDNERQLLHVTGQFFKDPASPLYDCIVIAPQCPTESMWVTLPGWVNVHYSTDETPESLPLSLAFKLIEEAKVTYPIDPDRVYSTGLSMGGYATWDLLVRHTDTCAAAIPVCGGADYRYAQRLKDVPIYTFHGDADNVVPPAGTERMVDELLKLGNEKVRCIYYVGGGHGVWENAFSTEGLFDWLLSHRRSDRA